MLEVCYDKANRRRGYVAGGDKSEEEGWFWDNCYACEEESGRDIKEKLVKLFIPTESFLYAMIGIYYYY